MACDAVAHLDHVPTNRMAEDQIVEGRDPFELCGRDTKFCSDHRDGAIRHPATMSLNDFERLDARSAWIGVMPYFMLDFGAFGVRQLERRLRIQINHVEQSVTHRSTSDMTKSIDAM